MTDTHAEITPLDVDLRQDHADLVARYTDRAAHITFYGVLWLVITGGAYLLFQYGAAQSDGPLPTEEILVGVGVLGAFVLAITIDLILVISAMATGKPALIIDKEGVQGFTGGFWRTFTWREVNYVYFDGANCCIVHEPRTALERFAHRTTWKRGLHRWKYEHAIVTPMKRIDRSRQAIEETISKYKPEALKDDAGRYEFRPLFLKP